MENINVPGTTSTTNSSENCRSSIETTNDVTSENAQVENLERDDTENVRETEDVPIGESGTGILLKNDESETEAADVKSISEAGRFSLAVVCALSLRNLFGDKWDEEFSTRSIRYIMTNLQLPKKVEPMMTELMKGDITHPPDPYIDLLKTEPFFEQDGLQTIVINLITLAVHEGNYDSRWRVLIQHIAELFKLESIQVDEYERKFINCILQQTTEPTAEEKIKDDSRKLMAKTKRYVLIGLATIGGGALIGVTGGLVAPLIGAGLTSLIGSTALFTAIGSVAGATIVGSLFGVAGGGLTGYKMHKRVGDIEEFEFHELNSLIKKELDNKGQSINTTKELHVTIVISGWIKNTSEESYTKPWSNLLNGREQYYLKYESSYLLELGKAMEYILTFAASFATQEVLKFTVLSGIVSAVAWPAGLLGLASVIDNPWGVCLRRSAQVGKQLAEVLLARSQGQRPVTLLGYSLGARVIFYCLREMSGRKNCEGIIQDVILIGAPCTAQASEWNKFRRVVAGRIVNGYCRGDWLLRFLYRTLSVAVDGVAGLQKIELNNRRMYNVDLTDMVTGHSDYPERMTEILDHIGVPISSENKP